MEKKICRIGQIAQMITMLTIAVSKIDASDKLVEINKYGECIESECAHWRQLSPRHEREDHSGGKEMILAEGVKTNRTPRREGPHGSCGSWILDSSGYCGLAGKP